MNIKELQEAVKFLRKSVNCPNCEKKYQTANIHFIGAIHNEVYFETYCEKCENSAMISVFQHPTEDEFIEEIYHTHDALSHDEYLDIKNYLKNFKGDISKLLSNE